MSLTPTHVIAAVCVVLASWSTSVMAAERAAILEDYYMDNPPNSAYLGKMKAKWASHVKARQKPESIDLMPAKPSQTVSRLKPAAVVVKAAPKPRPQTVKVTHISPKFVPKTVVVTRVAPKFVPKTVVVTRVAPKATVRRFTAPHRTVVVATSNKRPTERALPFWRDLPLN
ncbi:MAG: hypothetical protein WAQ53_16320 [Thiofilum sp.]|uniref:hypothetical protein n=1 Tax=Thiofilum sp. TaxID=2212733 RepID=UPI0025DB1EC7|nr:hypothetical protein [Thiofilum sp.]MBK8452414.1 hypothetical protein [Thiofilum sp.]